MGKQWKQCQTLFLGGSKITADGDCSHEIKRRLLLGRKVVTNLDSIFKSRDITLPTKFCLVKAMVFPVVMYGCESWTVKKAEHRRIDAFELWCWRRHLRVPWTARRSNQSILKKISPEYLFIGRTAAETETPILWPPDMKNWLIGKDSDTGRDWVPEEKGTTEDEMAGWHHWIDGHESEWTPGVGDGQGGLACCDSRGHKELDMTERLDWTELNWLLMRFNILHMLSQLYTLLWNSLLFVHCLFCPFRRPNNGLVYSVQFSLVTQSCLTLCDPRNCSTPGLPVHHQLPEFTQTRVHRVRDAIQPSHRLSSLSPPAPNPSQHQGLFQWVNYSHKVAKVLVFQL